MEQNYTPLNLNNFEDNKTTTFLLVLAIITLAILAVVLFLFIQKKLQEKDQIDYRQQLTPEVLISPSPTLTVPALEPEPTLPPATASPTIVNEEIPLPDSSSPTPIISPAIEETSTQP